MRIGLTTSVIGHVLLFAWGVTSFSGPEPFDAVTVDAMPVDLVPIGDVTKIAEGSKTAPKSNNASQGKVKNPVPRPDSKRVGAAATDQQAPLTEKATDTAAAKAAEPPPPPPKAPRPEEPKPEETKPADKPEETKVAAADPAPKADTGEIADKIKEADKPAPVPPKRPPTKPKPPKPKPEAEAPKPDKVTPTDKDSQSENFDPNEMAALLNKVDPSGGGGRASDLDASLGSENQTGAVAEMSQSELDALTSAVTACFNPPVGAEGVELMVVPLRVTFTIDGDLAGPPEVKAIPSGPAGQAVADAAVRAVQRCAPYPFLPKDKFDTWQVVNMNFSPPSSY